MTPIEGLWLAVILLAITIILGAGILGGRIATLKGDAAYHKRNASSNYRNSEEYRREVNDLRGQVSDYKRVLKDLGYAAFPAYFRIEKIEEK